jgi:hypothetical protein
VIPWILCRGHRLYACPSSKNRRTLWSGRRVGTPGSKVLRRRSGLWRWNRLNVPSIVIITISLRSMLMCLPFVIAGSRQSEVQNELLYKGRAMHI